MSIFLGIEFNYQKCVQPLKNLLRMHLFHTVVEANPARVFVTGALQFAAMVDINETS